jgi:glucoamylase
MRRRSTSLLSLAVGATLLASPAAVGAHAATDVMSSVAPSVVATGAPGSLSHFDQGRKDCLGTARNRTSRVWYTVANGVLSDVYEPNVDTTNIETMQFVVTDGATFTDLQTRDTTYTVSADRTGMVCTVTSTAKSGRYRLTTTYLTDPRRDSVVVHTRLSALQGSRRDLKLYVRVDPTIGGNGGGGAGSDQNAGADSAAIDSATGALVSSDTNTVTAAVNRDYAEPTFLAVRADRPFLSSTSGYAGTASDGLTQLDQDHALTALSTDAPDGNVVQTALLDTRRSGDVSLALGFGRTQPEAVAGAGATLGRSFAGLQDSYVSGWQAYDARLVKPAPRLPGLSTSRARALGDAYYLGANVLKASEDKQFPGAIVAAVASPWGQAVSAGTAADPTGTAPYFGSYREVFSRDLYEIFTGLLVDGDLATARDAARFLLEQQQLADGRIPRNSLVNGKSAPDTGGDQLDETAYPILMAWQAGLGGDTALYTDHIRKAADFLVSHGPSFGSERWEEQSGFSPSTIAAEIAGLVAAGRIADMHGDHDRAKVYRAVADDFQRNIKKWAVTTTGPYSASPYFIRLSKTGDPDAAITYGLGNGGPTEDQRAVVDAGFLELTRLGELPASDPDVANSLNVVDQVIGRDTTSGRGFYRYGVAVDPVTTAGTEDGYGDCYEPDPTTCDPTGKPWPGKNGGVATGTENQGSGHLWPVLSGERAEQTLQSGHAATASTLLDAMNRYSSGVGLVPEQAWEDPDVPASPFGTAPEVASIGFQNGRPAGSAAPLSWAQAQEVRLTLSIAAGRPLEQPQIVRARYVDAAPPALAPLLVTAPANNSEATDPSTTVTGTSVPGATVEVLAGNLDTGAATVVPATADATGAFAVTVPVGNGVTALTTTVTAGGATGYDQRSVFRDVVTGTSLLDQIDPTGDDNGPGTFAYPTSDNFKPGAFDLERFQVFDTGNDIVLRARLHNLDPTFGPANGAQLLDMYVRDPGAGASSTDAAFRQRNYSIAAGSAWTERIEVQGFAPATWVRSDGTAVPGATFTANSLSRYITVTLPKAQFGTPGPGWVFSVVLHGQDGFSSDQARAFAATPQDFSFGVCAAPNPADARCQVDPNTEPKAMDVIAPAGVDQATELDVTQGPVAIQGVSIP